MEWSKLINEKRDELAKAISEQYAEVLGGNTDLNYVVLLYNDGDISESYRTQSSSTMAEYNDEAICVYSHAGYAVDFDVCESLRNNKDIAKDVVDKYNALEIDEDEHIETFQEIDGIYSFLQDHFAEWLEAEQKATEAYELAEFDAYEVIDRKIEEEEACESSRG